MVAARDLQRGIRGKLRNATSELLAVDHAVVAAVNNYHLEAQSRQVVARVGGKKRHALDLRGVARGVACGHGAAKGVPADPPVRHGRIGAENRICRIDIKNRQVKRHFWNHAENAAPRQLGGKRNIRLGRDLSARVKHDAVFGRRVAHGNKRVSLVDPNRRVGRSTRGDNLLSRAPRPRVVGDVRAERDARCYEQSSDHHQHTPNDSSPAPIVSAHRAPRHPFSTNGILDERAGRPRGGDLDGTANQKIEILRALLNTLCFQSVTPTGQTQSQTSP